MDGTYRPETNRSMTQFNLMQGQPIGIRFKTPSKMVKLRQGQRGPNVKALLTDDTPPTTFLRIDLLPERRYSQTQFAMNSNHLRGMCIKHVQITQVS